jgi:hypothetical protein
MNKGDLDSYITDFKRLATEAGYDTNTSATVEIFYKGLHPKLARACLRWDTQPETMQEWIDSACTEQQKYAKLINFERAKQGKWTLPTGWGTKSNKLHKESTSRHHSNDETVPMNIDEFAACAAITESEKRKYRDEGRCFECHQKGHMACNCPNKKYKRNQSFKQKPFKNQQESSWRQRPNAFNKRATTFQK